MGPWGGVGLNACIVAVRWLSLGSTKKFLEYSLPPLPFKFGLASVWNYFFLSFWGCTHSIWSFPG